MFSVACWNVNSVKSRFGHLISWLREDSPDIVCLQELKCINEAFPAQEIEDLGYNIALNGQKTYNGVAILSKFPFDEIITELPNDPDPLQKRYIEASISINNKIHRICSVYVPNGQSKDSPKFNYKLKFFNALYKHSQYLLTLDEPVIICGDYNVAPKDIDVYDPEELINSICFTLSEKEAFRKLLYNGYNDAFRLVNQNDPGYTWWDYRAGSWPKNKGMRIDHILVSAEASDILKDVNINLEYRAKEKPSDHAQIVAHFTL